MVSVIVPYDRDRGYLDKCLASIYPQDPELIEIHSPNSFAKNFNAGLKKATCEFVKFVNEDDYLTPNSLKDLEEGIGDHPWVVGNVYLWRGQVIDVEKPGVLTLEGNVDKNTINAGSVLYRTDVLREIGGMDESLWTGEEYEMNLRLMSKGYLPGYIDKEVYVLRIWPGQKSRIYRETRGRARKEEILRIQNLYK